jgi:peptide/nickel transport system substrate-binding protein
MLFTNFIIADVVNPVVNILVNAKGKNGAWFGWPEDARMEAMRDAFVRSSSREEQKKIAAEIQSEVYNQVIYVPLGQWRGVGAWRNSLSGVLDGPATPVFWNIDKSD